MNNEDLMAEVLLENERRLRELRADLKNVYALIDSGRVHGTALNGLRKLAMILSETILILRKVREW